MATNNKCPRCENDNDATKSACLVCGYILKETLQQQKENRRELKAQDSHPESPEKKQPYAEGEEDEDMDDDMEFKDMFKTMMREMKSVRREVSGVKSEVLEAKIWQAVQRIRHRKLSKWRQVLPALWRSFAWI